MLEGRAGNIESKVRSAAEVLMRFFGATFFLEVEGVGAVISVMQGPCRSNGSQKATHGECGLATVPVHCLESRQFRRRPSAHSDSE